VHVCVCVCVCVFEGGGVLLIYKLHVCIPNCMCEYDAYLLIACDYLHICVGVGAGVFVDVCVCEQAGRKMPRGLPQ